MSAARPFHGRSAANISHLVCFADVVKVATTARRAAQVAAALVPLVWLAGSWTVAAAQSTAPAAPVPAAHDTPAAATASAATPGACAAKERVGAPDLPGLWQLALWPSEGSPAAPVSTGALLFEPHPEYPGSVRGALRRSGAGNDLHAFVSGDLIDGVFSLDESNDGVQMSAVWAGSWPADACGTEIRGTRRPAGSGPASEKALEFVLRKMPVAR